MNTWGKFVLVAIVGVVLVAGAIAIYPNRLTVGEAHALEHNEFPTTAEWATNSPAPESTCVTGLPCVVWTRDWHSQKQRVNGVMTTVEIFDWRCTGWDNMPGYFPATEPTCRKDPTQQELCK